MNFKMTVRNIRRRTRFLFLAAFLMVAACAANTSSLSVQPKRSSSAHNQPDENIEQRNPNSAIRNVDFGNFDYPLEKGRYWKIRKGRAVDTEDPVVLAYLDYGDVTSDGVEEAFVVLFENVRGSAIPYYVYVYTPGSSSPKLLWNFETGDRADGGLRRIAAQNGNLLVELYGKGTMVGGELYGTERTGACCPKSVTRTIYVWNGRRFSVKGSPEIIANDSSGAVVNMPKYNPL